VPWTMIPVIKLYQLFPGGINTLLSIEFFFNFFDFFFFFFFFFFFLLGLFFLYFFL